MIYYTLLELFHSVYPAFLQDSWFRPFFQLFKFCNHFRCLRQHLTNLFITDPILDSGIDSVG